MKNVSRVTSDGWTPGFPLHVRLDQMPGTKLSSGMMLDGLTPGFPLYVRLAQMPGTKNITRDAQS